MTRADIRRVGVPTAEPISVETAVQHLRVGVLEPADSPQAEPVFDQALIALYIAAARRAAEEFTGRAIADAVYELRAPGFAGGQCGLVLPIAPVRAVQSVQYLDVTGALQTMDLADVELDDNVDAPALYPAVNRRWPNTLGRHNAVRIRLLCGYTPPGESPAQHALPEDMAAGMLLTLGHLYENREDVSTVATHALPIGAERYLWPYRLQLGV